jgi:thiol-disulfide isomerase/thioredoxin
MKINSIKFIQISSYKFPLLKISICHFPNIFKKIIVFLIISIKSFALQTDSTFFSKELGLKFNDKPAIIDYWATWCGPCIASFKKSDSLIQTYKDRINFYAITNDKKKNVDEFLRKNKYSYTFIHDSLSISSKKYDIVGIPEILVLDKKGDLIWRGYPKLSSEFLNKIIAGEKIEDNKVKQENTIALNKLDLPTNTDYYINIIPSSKIKYTVDYNVSGFKNLDSKVLYANSKVSQLLKNTFFINSKYLSIEIKKSEMLDERTSIVYLNKKDSKEIGLIDYRNKVLSHYDLKFDTLVIKTNQYDIENINTQKLENFSTTLMSKEGQNKGSYVGNEEIDGKKYMIAISYNYQMLLSHLDNIYSQQFFKYGDEGHFDLLIRNLPKYDFELPLTSIEDTLEVLNNKYGIKLISRPATISKYIIIDK